MINDPERFSIDVDIITEESKESVEVILKKLVDNGNFKKFHEKQRKTKEFPKLIIIFTMIQY